MPYLLEDLVVDRVDLVDEGTEIDAEDLIETAGPEDKTVPAAAVSDGDDETVLDESDELGDIDEDDGMDIREIDESGEISVAEEGFDDTFEEEVTNEEEDA